MFDDRLAQIEDALAALAEIEAERPLTEVEKEMKRR